MLLWEYTFKCLCDVIVFYLQEKVLERVSCFLTGCFRDALKSQGSPEYKHTSLEGLGNKLSTFKHTDLILLNNTREEKIVTPATCHPESGLHVSPEETPGQTSDISKG